ncbi:hypothetical protein UFOVP256_34 [uncultured Caudovirales phage]|uniref:Uncharacterized protein n=1 Tax=uncultured Caudovirales phage TaxID=2100421 RepID=A0A6J5LL80_9CAUD|nr:hypothetical protein UFOVP256_34 [uncultured Caudovirales phage]
MKWIDVGGAMVNFEKVTFVMKNVDEQSNLYALRFHYSPAEYLETKFLDSKMMDDFFINLNGILNRGKSDMGTAVKD